MSAAVLAASFVALYAGHMVGDHIVQTDWQAAHKADKGRTGVVAMAGHVIGYGLTQTVACAALLLAGAPLSLVGLTVGLVVSVATHAFIDRRWPVQWILRRTGSDRFAALTSNGMNGPYLADQALHIGCLFVAAVLMGVLS